VRRHYDALRAAGAEVLVITQARPELLAAFLREEALPFPVVTDPTRRAYEAFGLGRTSWSAMLRPGVLLGYLRLIFRGWRPRRWTEGEDVWQLGGDFVLDGEGRVAYAYRSAESTDRPAVGELIEAVQKAGGTRP
jgi:peroxiredoxin